MNLQQTIETAPANPTAFHDLMAGVGYMLFQWSMIERSLDDEIGALRRAAGDVAAAQPRARSVNERLGEWRALIGRGRRRNADQHATADRLGEQIQDLLRLRNLVANGLASASLDGMEPVIRCSLSARHGAPDEVRLAMADLLGAIEAMEATRSEMALLRTHLTH